MNWNLETEQYYVRFAQENDIPPIFQLLGREDVVQHHPKNPMVVEAQALDEARRMVMQFEAKEAAFWLVEEKTTGNIIARISLQKFNWVSASAQLVLDILPDYKMTEYVAELIYAVLTLAYEDLSLHRVEWLLQQSDPQGCDLVKNLGFQHEGQLRSVFEFEGHWIDYQVYSLLNSDECWQQVVQQQGFKIN